MKSFKSIINLVKTVATDVAENAKVLDEKLSIALDKATERKAKETPEEKKTRIAKEVEVLKAKQK